MPIVAINYTGLSTNKYSLLNAQDVVRPFHFLFVPYLFISTFYISVPVLLLFNVLFILYTHIIQSFQ
jgi:hypothetical protein